MNALKSMARSVGSLRFCLLHTQAGETGLRV